MKHAVARLVVLTCVSFGDSELIFLHVGKGGGGTIDSRMAQFQKAEGGDGLAYSTCHSVKCPDKLTPGVKVFMDIRDPVDRLVSAFEWRRYVLARDGIKYVRERAEWLALNKTKYSGFAGDVNKLAESLCPQEPDYELARQATTIIGHIHLTLASYLGGMDRALDLLRENSPGPDFYIAPLEPGFDYIALVDSMASQLAHDVLPEQAASRVSRRVKPYDPCSDDSQRSLHASSRITGPVPLSDKATRCATLFYAEEYALVNMFARVGCRGRLAMACQSALRSMVSRRAHYLVEHELFNNSRSIQQ